MRNIYQDVTDKIVAALDQGVAPWIKPWSSSGSTDVGNHQPYPINAVTQRPYSGINLPLLWAEARLQGFTQDRWLTFNQAKKAGGHIRKGEHSTLAVLYKPMEREEQTESGQPVMDENGQPKIAHFGILKTHFLFNIEQTEGLETLNETMLETEPSDPLLPQQCCRKPVAKFGREYHSSICRRSLLPPDQGSHPTADKIAISRSRWILRHCTSRADALDRTPLSIAARRRDLSVSIWLARLCI